MKFMKYYWHYSQSEAKYQINKLYRFCVTLLLFIDNRLADVTL